MNCIIIDDDEMSRRALKHLAEQSGLMTITGIYPNAVEASGMLMKENDVDLILLDVEMPGMTGLELLKNVQKMPLVILTTSKKEYAVEAFEYNVVDYLLKPVSYPRFLKAAEKANDIFNSSVPPSSNNKGNESVFIKSKSILLKINTGDILWIEALGDYATLHTAQKNHTVHCTLKVIESTLPPDKFIRIHRSFIVAINKINAIDETVVIINEKLIPIGAVYRENLMSRLNFL